MKKKIVKVFHNPTAGDEEHSRKDLISIIEENGYECRYASVKKKGWKEIEPEVDFIVAAGGDGTVRKVVGELLDRKMLQKTLPIALLPLGTANNIATTLGITGSSEEIVRSWQTAKIKKFDIGRIEKKDEPEFFLEAFGYGIFPYLMLEMKKRNPEEIELDAEKRNLLAMQLLHEITIAYEPHNCTLFVDGLNVSGRLLLAEIMNTRSMGPNLFLAPDADPGDGKLEVILLPEERKDLFTTYVMNKLSGSTETYEFRTLRGKDIRISWEGTHVHVDDKLLKLNKNAEVRVELKEGLVEFLVPEL